jgi:hypothetical protein
VALGTPQLAIGPLTRLPAVIQAVVPHQDGLILPPNTRLQDLAHKQGVIPFGYLADYLTFPPCGQIEKEGTARVLAQFKTLPPNDIALRLLGFEKSEGNVFLILTDHIDGKDPGVLDLLMHPRIHLDAHGDKRRLERGLSRPVDRSRIGTLAATLLKY